MHRRRIAATLVLLVLGAVPARAQTPGWTDRKPDPQVAPAGAGDSVVRVRGTSKLDLANPDSPRGAIAGYLIAARAGDYHRAASYLDLSELSPEARAERGAVLARQLKVVLDRQLWIDVEGVSDRPQGDLGDGLSPDREVFGAITTRQGPLKLRLRRGEDPVTGDSLWRVSPRLVERIPGLYQEFGPGPIGSRVPPLLYTVRILEIELWQWIGLLIAAVLSYGLAMLVTRLGFWLLRVRAKRKQKTLDEQLLHGVRVQMQLVFGTGLLLLLATFVLRLPILVHGVLLRIGAIFVVIVIAWSLSKLSGVLWSRLRAQLHREDRRSGVTLTMLGERVTNGVLIALALIVVLQQIGFQVSGLLTGLGVGGVALALAAQKSVANLLGGFALATDQPVRVGDFCRFGDQSGRVEEIGMRSTRIRTMDRSVVTIPNSTFAEVQIENLSSRDRMRLLTVLNLRCETTPDQLRAVLAGLRRLLSEDARVFPHPLRVRFTGVGAYSLDIEVMTYIATSDQDQFLEVREDLLLKMLDIVTECGSGIAFPSQTIYSAVDSGIGPGSTRQAEPALPPPAAGGDASRDPGDG